MSEQHRLNNEMNAAIHLRQALGELAEDDQLVADMIEGETDLHEMIGRVFLSIDEDQILITGVKERQKELADRKSRLEKRVNAIREMIGKAMEIGEISKLELPTATLSLRRVPLGLVVEKEEQIPAEYFVEQDPRLDKKILLEALKDGEAVPGATLSNGGETLAIRRK